MHRALLATLVLLLGAGTLPAQTAPLAAGDSLRTRTLRAAPATGEIRIDGRLDEAAWAAAEPATGFVQNRPTPGAPASERTEARVLYDGGALYVGMRLYDARPDSITAPLGRRDLSGVPSDWAHVLVDSYHDRRTGFRFSVNPRGVKKDVLHFDDWAEDLNWDGVWEAETRVDSLGWTAEFRIPLGQLRFSAARGGGEQVWGINVSREIARRTEWAWWSPVLPNVPGMVSVAGELHGLQGLSAPRGLEVLPYTVSRMTRAPAQPGNPFYRRNEPAASAGADLKYGLTSSLTLTATLNPDFGQVEADPAVVNLSAFESFFPERRPFFVEGSNIFNFSVGTSDNAPEQLFYSRRVGREPQRRVSEQGGWVDAPGATTILGAAKLSGRTRSGWSVGLLDALTQGEEARVLAAGGAERMEPVEPLTNYAVARAIRDFRRGQSAVGGIFTATHRQLGDEDLRFLRSAAYTGGVDLRHRFGRANGYSVSAFLVGSHVLGSREAISRTQLAPGRYFQRPDADHVEFDSTRTSLSGLAGNFWASKLGGNWRLGAGGHFRTPGVELNDAGFQTEADYAMLFGNTSYVQFKPGRVFRNWSVGVNPSVSWTWEGERRHGQVNLFGGFELLNSWGGNVWLSRSFQGFAAGELRGGPGIVRPAANRANLSFYSDRRKPVSGSVGFFVSREDESGGLLRTLSPQLTVRPSGRLDLSLQPSFRWNSDAWQYVGTGTGLDTTRYLFARLDQTTASLTARLSYTFTPDLSLQLYAQPFVSGGDYSEFKMVADPRAEHFSGRFRVFGEGRTRYDAERRRYGVDLGGDEAPDLFFRDPDFGSKQFRSNAVLRWEYRPGSTLFVVWSQGRVGRDADGSFRFGRDMGRLLEVEPTNVLLVKLNYWLNL